MSSSDKRKGKAPIAVRSPDTVEEDNKAKHQNLLMAYLELQKEYVSKKKRLQAEKQKKAILHAEVEFLKRRHRNLLEIKALENARELEVQGSDEQDGMLAEERNGSTSDAERKDPSKSMRLNHVLVGKEQSGKGKQILKKRSSSDKNFKNGLTSNGRAGKKKISWQDQAPQKL